MTTKLMTAVTTSISEVLETMFFLPVEFPQDTGLAEAGLENDEEKLACRLSFSGDISGRVFFLVPTPLVTEMAENFMGEPAETLEDSHVHGTLTEMLNMVCGNALSKLSANRPFDLGLPEMIPASEFPANGGLTIIDAMMAKMAMAIQIDQ